MNNIYTQLIAQASPLLIGFLVEYLRWRSRKTGMWKDKWPCRKVNP